MSTTNITFRLPFDAHRHLRDGEILSAVARFASQHFCGGIVMPNLVPPIVTYANAVSYRQRIEEALANEQGSFRPLMTLYLTDNTDPDDVARAYEDGVAHAVKLYPLGGTTNSDSAVTNIRKVDVVLRRMEQIGMPLLIHGERPREVDGELVDHYDREALYVENELQALLDRHPNLRISLEHISSETAVEFINQYGSRNRVATVTPHHLMFDRRVTVYTQDAACMPIIKAQRHKEALRNLVASGCPWVHLGTDCAPHLEASKQAVVTACGCFTGPHAIPLYLQAFTELECLNLFEQFASIRGPAFFGLSPSEEFVSYEPLKWELDGMVPVPGGGEIRPFRYRSPTECASLGVGNLQLQWRLIE